MGEGLRGGRQLNIIFKALRNMVRNSSTKYRQLLSVERLSEQGACFSAPCELRSQLRRWRYFVDRISSMFRSFKKLYLAACLPLSPPHSAS